MNVVIKNPPPGIYTPEGLASAFQREGTFVTWIRERRVFVFEGKDPKAVDSLSIEGATPETVIGELQEALNSAASARHAANFQVREVCDVFSESLHDIDGLETWLRALDQFEWKPDRLLTLIEQVRAAQKWLAGTHTAECLARKAGSAGGNDPQDCDWPFCGCDPHATKVLEVMEECGFRSPREFENVRDALEGITATAREVLQVNTAEFMEHLRHDIAEAASVWESAGAATPDAIGPVSLTRRNLRGELAFLLDSTVDLPANAYDRDTLLMRLESAFISRPAVNDRVAMLEAALRWIKNDLGFKAPEQVETWIVEKIYERIDAALGETGVSATTGKKP